MYFVVGGHGKYMDPAPKATESDAVTCQYINELVAEKSSALLSEYRTLIADKGNSLY